MAIRGDLYRIIVPVVIGQVEVICDPTRMEPTRRSTGEALRPGPINALDFIDGLTPGLAASLRAEELQAICEEFVAALRDFIAIETFYGYALAEAARADFASSIQCAFMRPADFGMSRWHSLQAAEKFLKALLSFTTTNFEPKKHGHSIKRLADTARAEGLFLIDEVVVEKLTFAAGVRYGEVDSTLEDARQAHLASRHICALVATAARTWAGAGSK